MRRMSRKRCDGVAAAIRRFGICRVRESVGIELCQKPAAFAARVKYTDCMGGNLTEMEEEL